MEPPVMKRRTIKVLETTKDNLQTSNLNYQQNCTCPGSLDLILFVDELPEEPSTVQNWHRQVKPHLTKLAYHFGNSYLHYS